MAKWGEGDPRWIVEEREDAKNVNNWHWTEKDATLWSINRIKGLLTGFVAQNSRYYCEVISVSKCEGEAVANNRKAKLIFFYEWHIELEWSGKIKDSENNTNYTGKIEVPNLSEENTPDELDVTVTINSSDGEAFNLKEFMRMEGAKGIRQKLGVYVKSLKEEYSSNLILPSKGKVADPACTSRADEASAAAAAAIKNGTGISQEPKDSSSSTLDRTIKINSEFFCAPDDLFKVLTTKELIQAFTRSEASSDPIKDGAYIAFGGNVTGIYEDLIPPHSITMRWRRKIWPENHFSTLKMKLEAIDSGTRLTIEQLNVPDFDYERTSDGWEHHYIIAIKQTFGYGGRVF